ncbi:MAG: pyridoxamine 5'-phosphate oxidase family protein [Candidatus Binatia bacterium]
MRKPLVRALVLSGVSLLPIVQSNSVEGREETAVATSSASPVVAEPAMSADELQEFLARPLIARLATSRANGTPQVTPMWFLYEDGIVYMSTRPSRAKVRHIKANPNVAVVVDVMEAPLKNKVVTFEGSVELVTTGVKEVTTKIYQKYMGIEGAKSPPAQQSIDAPRIILKMVPKTVQTIDTTR